MNFSKIKLDFFSESLKVANLLQNAYLNGIIVQKIDFRLNYEVFQQKNQKNFEAGKIRNYHE